VTAPPGSAQPSDAELVARVLAADRVAFAIVYDRYGGKLYDFAYAMLRHREDAADAVADSFVLFAERLTQLREPDRLRPWLYAIVRSECLRRLKARKRVAYGDEEQLVAVPDDALTPHEVAERAALQQLVWDASAGLADRDRALLDLHLRQGLEGAELGEAIGVSASNAYVMLNRLRAQVDRSLGALLIARLGRDDCDDLDALLTDWDGSFSPLIRKRVARHVEQCDVCGERKKRVVSPWALLAGVPMFAAPLGLRDRVLRDTQLVAYELPQEVTSGGGSVGGTRFGAGRTTFAALALLALVVAALVLLWPQSDDTADDVSPTDATPTSQATTAPTATAAVSPSPATESEPTPSQSQAPTPSETPTQLPGTLTLSTRAIDLGRAASRGTFGLTNSGELPVDYQVSSHTPWLRLASIGGRLAGDYSTQVTVVADRSQVSEGVSRGRVLVTWDGGRAVVTVTLDEERPPVISAAAVPANASCEVDVTATVTDESALKAVTLVWSGPSGSGRTAMTLQSGATWTAHLSVAVGGDFTLRVVATDARGNSGTGPETTAAINPCPQ